MNRRLLYACLSVLLTAVVVGTVIAVAPGPPPPPTPNSDNTTPVGLTEIQLEQLMRDTLDALGRHTPAI